MRSLSISALFGHDQRRVRALYVLGARGRTTRVVAVEPLAFDSVRRAGEEPERWRSELNGHGTKLTEQVDGADGTWSGEGASAGCKTSCETLRNNVQLTIPAPLLKKRNRKR